MANNTPKAVVSDQGPFHIAFIMDGNGRWANKRGQPREFGHKAGAEAFRKVLKRCSELNLRAATFYVFSTENWKRPEKEVNAIIKLLERYLDECEKEIKKQDVRFIFIGDRSVFSQSIQNKMSRIEDLSRNASHIANLAINYGGRDEITRVVNRFISDGNTNITESDITNALYTKDSPPVDMIVRTGGDLRISNFLLWQAAYSELYFTDKLWPDFQADDVDFVIEEFKKRKRRYGGI